jgi:formiminoglutamase
VAEWFTKLEPISPWSGPWSDANRPDDPRLAEMVEVWDGRLGALTPGRAVIVGFPQDEGVRRNNGRPGAAQAPPQIRHWLYRLTTWHPESSVNLADHPLLDVGNVRIRGALEDSQEDLAQIVAAILKANAIPIVLGGGHEAAYGHYLGYVGAGINVGIINLDAHLDVRPYRNGLGHSGSSFRQAMEHPTHPLPGNRYACLAAQPHSVSRLHYEFVRERGGKVYWCDEVRTGLLDRLTEQIAQFSADGCRVYITSDADAVSMAEVPGVSAPNSDGISANQILAAARLAGSSEQVSSFDIVEISPRLDRDNQSSRWAALAVWNFLLGLARRGQNAG